MTNEPVPPPRIRPGWVWGIFIFYLVISVWGLMAQALIHLGLYPIPEAQQAMLRNQSRGAVLFSIGLGVLNLMAAFWLWLLRKRAFELFMATFILGVVSVMWQIIQGGPLASVMNQGALMLVMTWFSVIVGWGISLAICVYVWTLRQSGVLR